MFIIIQPVSMRALYLCFVCLAGFGLGVPAATAQDAAPATAGLEKALISAKEEASEARQRLAVRRVIRDAEKLCGDLKDNPERFAVLEFLFRARQQFIALDKDPKNREELLETCRDLAKAPDNLAGLRFEADLLLSQVELARQGANSEARAEALRTFAKRYVDTPVGAKVMRMAMAMALELGDERLVDDLQQIIRECFPSDLEMIRYQREKLGGDVFAAPFCGSFERSDGKTVRFPMDMLGRSTMLVFWSKEGEGMDYIKGLAADALEMKDTLGKRLEIISFNLDELPDAGESIVLGLGVNWQVLRLPGGRKNPVYDAYARNDPTRLDASPTGQAAIIMEGTGRFRIRPDGTIDHSRMLGSALGKSWARPSYVMQLSSLFAGDFLVLDPEGGIDLARPPELKATAKGQEAKPLARSNACVPEKTLEAIQDAFVAPPLRYRLSHDEARASYSKVVLLCHKAISDHPQAPDLWIVRNRLIIALMGLWKIDADLSRLDAAFAEAKAAMAAGYPAGCDTIARFCLARESLRDAGSDSQDVIDEFLASSGGENAPGTAFATAALLSLDVADHKRFKDYRGIILRNHAEEPMMWTFAAFLLDRYQDYYLFQVPFSAGRTYGYRETYFLSRGTPEEAKRSLHAEFKTLDGETVRFPDATTAKWTAMVLAAPWWNGEAPSPEGDVKGLIGLAGKRPAGEMEPVLVVFSEDAEKIRASLEEKPLGVRVLLVPGGMASPLVRRLGMLSEDERTNRVLLRKDGTIATMVSGLSMLAKASGAILENTMNWQDEAEVSDAIERGDLPEAKRIAFSFAPVFDAQATDEKGRKLVEPKYQLAHLRARARVYMAIEEWDKALADAEEVVQRQLGAAGGMSLRTDELDESEALRDAILTKKGAAHGAD